MRGDHLRPARPQRQRQIHHHPHALRRPRPHLRQRHRHGLRTSVKHAAESIKRRIGYMSQKLRPLRRSFRARKSRFLRRRIYGLDPGSHQDAHQRRPRSHLPPRSPTINCGAAQLSGGWKQRLALLCALIHEPDVIFLDEPTAGIDPVARRQFWDLLFTLSAQGVTFFVTTHYMDEAERCTDVGYIYMSKLIALGSVADLQELSDAEPSQHLPPG